MHDLSFFSAALNALPEHVCIINEVGDIQFVNQAWIDFGASNSPSTTFDWCSINYFDACESASQDPDDELSQVISGIQSVALQKIPAFSAEYPCHSDNVQRWFLLRCSPFKFNDTNYTLLQHIDITKKKRAVINSNIDELTGVANRRAFNTFFSKEWSRCTRLNVPISTIVIDIDNFKSFNDTYGHVKGDWCLEAICSKLKVLAKRPSDMFCRYGGEEFVYVLGNTNSLQALEICAKVHQALAELNIEHKGNENFSRVTVSIGVACCHPDALKEQQRLLECADHYLYDAKAQGKNTTRYHQCNSKVCTERYCDH